MSGPSFTNNHRPALAWLSDLQKAKNEGNSGKPRVTIQDLLDKINDPNAPEQALIPSSPRSVEACFRLGIDPVDLQYHPPAWYRRKEDADGDVSSLRYERNENVRQERLKALMDTRKALLDEGWGPQGDGTGMRAPGAQASRNFYDEAKAAQTSAMVEKERQRLEVLKRRQERELAQMVAHENTRKQLLEKQQEKVDQLERRQEELARTRQEHEIARMNKQREIELQKAAEEREAERKARQLAEERYQHEKRMQAEKEELDRQMKKRAYQEEMERRRKAEDARRETEAILAAQAEEVRQRKLDMDKRDAERLKRMALETKQRHALNQEKRKKADERIASALQANNELLHRKRTTFEQKEAEAAERKRELDELNARMEAQKRDEELRKEQERHAKYQAALALEEARKARIKARAEEKDRMLADLYNQRKKEHDLRKVESDFQLKLRLDKVDAIQKTSLYSRHQLLERIMDDYDKTRRMMKEREELQEQRKMANMHASMMRQGMAAAMEKLAFSKGAGSLSVEDLMARSRPATAMF